MYRLIPVNAMTKLSGKFAELEMPEALRKPIYGLYALLFGCQMQDSEKELGDFLTFNAFFTRSLKEGIRPVDELADLVAPADGRIMAMGRIEAPLLRDPDGSPLAFPETIKGVSYPMRQLVTEPVFRDLARTSDHPIYYCTIYLAPGDYHRFHSPARWTQTAQPTPISGEVLSVAPYMMRWARNLLCLNERTVLSGHWKHGAFSMIPVGAANVSSIRLSDHLQSPKAFLEKGELLGMFEMGSTVVLLFHAPKEFTWTPKVGDRIKVGEALGTTPNKTYRFINGLY